jgi:isopenicillin N synthase-like dioxygenase
MLNRASEGAKLEAAPLPDCANRADSSVIPVVDISQLTSRDSVVRRRAAHALGEAAEEVGFVYIVGHGVDPALIQRVLDRADAFFTLPQAEKERYHVKYSAHHRGYVPVTEVGNYNDEKGGRHYEAFDLAVDLAPDDPDIGPDKPLLGPNVWPDVDAFRETISEYYSVVAGVGRQMCRGFEMHLGLDPGYLDQYMRKPTSQLRLLHYLPNNAPCNEAAMNMGAHTDYECFTILHQAHPGLQVLTVDDQWLDAEPIDGSFVINIGDMLEAWTNGRFRSTLHRVVNVGTERYSIPFFVAADYDAKVAPLKPFVTPGKQPRYETITAGHHLLGNMLRDFGYLRERYERGEITLPSMPPPQNPFENKGPNLHVSEDVGQSGSMATDGSLILIDRHGSA